MTMAPSCSAGMLERVPPILPMAVRQAPTSTISLLMLLSSTFIKFTSTNPQFRFERTVHNITFFPCRCNSSCENSCFRNQFWRQRQKIQASFQLFSENVFLLLKHHKLTKSFLFKVVESIFAFPIFSEIQSLQTARAASPECRFEELRPSPD